MRDRAITGFCVAAERIVSDSIELAMALWFDLVLGWIDVTSTRVGGRTLDILAKSSVWFYLYSGIYEQMVFW